MKKIISLVSVMAILFSFTSCHKNQTYDSWRIVSSYNTTENNKHGKFIVDQTSSQLSFLDFKSMKQSLICDDPTCKHGSGCSSNGKNNHPFIYNDKLYYFKQTDTARDGDLYYMSSQLWQSDINGTNEKQITEFKNLNYDHYDRLLLDGNMMYMCMYKQPFDKDFKTLEKTIEFVSFNLDTNEIKNYGEICKGYSSGSYIDGKWNDCIVFHTSNSEDNRPYLEKVEDFAKEKGLSNDKAAEQFQDKYIYKYYKFDIKNDKITDNDLPEPLEITNSCYFYKDKDVLKYITQNNKTKEINLKNFDSIQSYGKYCLIACTKEVYIYNTETEEILKYKDKYNDFTVNAEYEDYFILEKFSADGTGSTLEKAAVNEIGEKI